MLRHWLSPPDCSSPGLALLAAQVADQPPEKPERPRLVVLVVFDQFRGDYLGRWEELGEGGFRRLTADGAWFTNCHYPYAYTVTAAGHASVATGCPPADHGVVGNDWYDRAAGKSVNCVGSDRHEQVPARTAGRPTRTRRRGRRGGVSPAGCLKPTVADALKAATGGKAKVVALSLKNRGAVLPGGQAAGRLLLDGRRHRPVRHLDVLPRRGPPVGRGVQHGRAGRPVARQDWDRLRADLDYAKLSGPDDAAGEGKGWPARAGVPAPVRAGRPEGEAGLPDRGLHLARSATSCSWTWPRGRSTPRGSGPDDVPDLLSLSFSSNDAVGHAWGPDSQEVLDVTLRTDAVVRGLLDVLDAKVGKGRYVLALTARPRHLPAAGGSPGARDGGGPGPGRGRRQAGRGVPGREVRQGGRRRRGWRASEQAVDLPGPEAVRSRPAPIDAAEDRGRPWRAWLEQQPGVQAAYTRPG